MSIDYAAIEEYWARAMPAYARAENARCKPTWGGRNWDTPTNMGAPGAKKEKTERALSVIAMCSISEQRLAKMVDLSVVGLRDYLRAHVQAGTIERVWLGNVATYRMRQQEAAE